MPIALADLVPLVCLGVAIALTMMVVAIVRGFFGVTGSTLGKLPVIGGWIDATGHHIEQRITHELGKVVLRLESAIGASWHMSARLIDWIGREISRHAGLLALIASLLSPLGAVAGLARAISAARALIHSLVHRLEGIGHDLGGRIGHVERGIGADVLPRIRGLEREVNGEITRERVRARAAERTAEREITNLWKWTRTHTLRAGTLAFTGAVAYALAHLGLGWLRCKSLGRIGSRLGCGGFGALEDLLFGAVTAVAATDLCDVADVAAGVALTIRPVLMELVDVENALIGCHGATLPPALGIAPLSLPPVRNQLPLAA